MGAGLLDFLDAAGVDETIVVEGIDPIGLGGLELLPEGLGFESVEAAVADVDQDDEVWVGFENLFGGEGDVAADGAFALQVGGQVFGVKFL